MLAMKIIEGTCIHSGDKDAALDHCITHFDHIHNDDILQ